MELLRCVAAVSAAALIVSCCSCSGSEEKSDTKKKKDISSSKVEKLTTDEQTTKEDKDEIPVLTASQCEHIMQLYNFMSREDYSIDMDMTDAEGKVTHIYRVVRGDDYYQLQTDNVGTKGSIRLDGVSYDFDNVCGIYRQTDKDELDSIAKAVVEQDLPATATHIDPNDAAVYDVEEYTYTGSTYIAVIDFCFDRKTGVPVKYTTTYTVEGVDDRKEVRVINSLKPEGCFSADGVTSDGEDITTDTQEHTGIDDSVFDLSFTTKLKDFGALSEEARMGYCQAIFVTAGVSSDELAGEDITDEKLKNISYEDFIYLVYTYGYDQR